MELKFKSAILYKQKHNLKIQDIVYKDELSKGQILVKIIYSGICGSQIGERNGVKGKDKFLPHLLGHEATGIVVKVGPKVKLFKKKDKVILHWRESKGISSQNPRYFYKNKIINAGKVTTFNEYAVVSENRLTKIPKGLSLKNAVIFGCAATTGYGAVNYDAKINKKNSILIFGSGGIGLHVLISCLNKKVKNVIVVDKFKKKLTNANSFGNIKQIVYRNQDRKKMMKEIYRLNNNLLPDVVIDTTGNTKIIELCYQLLNKKGKLLLLGVQKYKEKVRIATLPILLGKKIIGSSGGSCLPFRDIPKIFKEYKKNNIKFNKFYNRVFPLSKINEAIKKMSNGELAERVLIKLN